MIVKLSFFLYLLQVGLLCLAEMYLHDEFRLDPELQKFEFKSNALIRKLAGFVKTVSSHGNFYFSEKLFMKMHISFTQFF